MYIDLYMFLMEDIAETGTPIMHNIMIGVIIPTDTNSNINCSYSR